MKISMMSTMDKITAENANISLFKFINFILPTILSCYSNNKIQVIFVEIAISKAIHGEVNFPVIRFQEIRDVS